MPRQAWVVDPADNVATIIADHVHKGARLEIDTGTGVVTVPINEDIIYGHKVAIRPIAPGQQVTKYGLSIGSGTQSIAVGDWVHDHNMESNRGRGDRFAAAPGQEKGAFGRG